MNINTGSAHREVILSVGVGFQSTPAFVRLSPSAAPSFGSRQRRSIQPALRQNISFFAVLFSRSPRRRSIQLVASLYSRLSYRSGCCYDCSATPQRFLQQSRTFVRMMMFLLVNILNSKTSQCKFQHSQYQFNIRSCASTATDIPRDSRICPYTVPVFIDGYHEPSIGANFKRNVSNSLLSELHFRTVVFDDVYFLVFQVVSHMVHLLFVTGNHVIFSLLHP